ncbi:MAG: hypothetical protein WCS34_01485 [Bacteroidales bacterium]
MSDRILDSQKLMQEALSLLEKEYKEKQQEINELNFRILSAQRQVEQLEKLIKQHLDNKSLNDSEMDTNSESSSVIPISFDLDDLNSTREKIFQEDAPQEEYKSEEHQVEGTVSVEAHEPESVSEEIQEEYKSEEHQVEKSVSVEAHEPESVSEEIQEEYKSEEHQVEKSVSEEAHEPESVSEENPEDESIDNSISANIYESEVKDKESPKVLGETFETNEKIIVDAAKSDQPLWMTAVPGEHIDYIQEALSLNDRMCFTRELFDLDDEKFEEAIETINVARDFSEVVSYMRENFPQINEDSDTVYRFYMLVRRRFR